jgi:predicted AAA+ superfamily ATPase
LLGALKEFKLNEGLILTYNQDDEFKIEDKIVKVISVWRWLLEE